MAGRRLTGRGGRGAALPTPPPLPPPAWEPQERPSAPPEPRGRPPPQKGPRRGGGGCGWTCTPRAPAPPAACSRGGRGRRASPHQRARATRAPSLGAVHGGTPEQYGGHALHDPPVTTAHSGRAEGGFRSAGPPGGAVHGPPLTPPHPGAALRPRPHAHAGGECADDTRGAGIEYRRPPPRRGAGRPRRDPPPPNPPQRPASRGGPGPNPPRQGGWSPPPPKRGAGARPAPPPQPPAPTGAAKKKRARANTPGRRTDRAQRRRASTNRSGMGGHAPHGQHDASDTRFVARPGKAEGRNEAERLPALQAPPGRTNGGYGTCPPPPPGPRPGTRTPRTRPAARSHHRACKPRGQRRAPTPSRPRPQHVDSGPQQPAQWAGSRGRGSA